MIRNQYNPSDFAANPAKYQQFRGAVIASRIFTENGEDDLEQGQPVAITYFRTAWNAMRRRDEPIYSVTANGKVWGMVYGNVLADFVP